jgi:branched-chain amino acid aminotransferase
MTTPPAQRRIAWFNGRFVPEHQVLIPFRDRGWKFGDAAFDATCTFHGRTFRLEEHIARLYRSLRARFVAAGPKCIYT